MNRSLIVLALLGVGALAAVGATAPGDLPPCVQGAFVGITETDPNGTILGRPDTRDWGCVGSPGGGGGAASGQVVARDVPIPPPTTLCFEPAAPNPAAGSTRLQFALPTTGHVRVVVYGRSHDHGPPETFVARTLVDATLAPGFHTVEWDLRSDGGTPLAPGIYRCILETGGEALCGDIEVR